MISDKHPLNENMDKQNRAVSIILLLSLISLSASAFTTDDVFTKLIYNTDTCIFDGCYAIYEFCNPADNTPNPIPLSSLKHTFYDTPISTQELRNSIEIEKTINYYVTINDYSSREVCTINENTSQEVCYTEQYVSGSHQEQRSKKEFVKPTTKEKIGVGECVNIKINGYLPPNYAVDWKPEATINGITYKQDKWAVWNSTYNIFYDINITYSGENVDHAITRVNFTDYPQCIGDTNSIRVVFNHEDITAINKPFEWVNGSDIKELFFLFNDTTLTTGTHLNYSLWCNATGSTAGNSSLFRTWEDVEEGQNRWLVDIGNLHNQTLPNIQQQGSVYLNYSRADESESVATLTIPSITGTFYAVWFGGCSEVVSNTGMGRFYLGESTLARYNIVCMNNGNYWGYEDASYTNMGFTWENEELFSLKMEANTDTDTANIYVNNSIGALGVTTMHNDAVSIVGNFSTYSYGNNALPYSSVFADYSFFSIYNISLPTNLPAVTLNEGQEVNPPEDTTPPTLLNPSVNSTSICVNSSVSINVTVYDNVAGYCENISNVTGYFTTPLNSCNLSFNAGSNCEWYFFVTSTSECNTSTIGNYSYSSQWANDTSNNVNSTNDNITLEVINCITTPTTTTTTTTVFGATTTTIREDLTGGIMRVILDDKTLEDHKICLYQKMNYTDNTTNISGIRYNMITCFSPASTYNESNHKQIGEGIEYFLHIESRRIDVIANVDNFQTFLKSNFVIIISFVTIITLVIIIVKRGYLKKKR